MHCTVDDHRRHCCRLLKKKAGSQNSTRLARPDSCIQQNGPSITAQLCPQQMSAIICRWFFNYMQNGRNRVYFRQQESNSRKLKKRLVHSGVLSPALSIFYLGDIPTPSPNMKLIKYADDITIYASGQVVIDQINGLNIYLSHVLNYMLGVTIDTQLTLTQHCNNIAVRLQHRNNV